MYVGYNLQTTNMRISCNIKQAMIILQEMTVFKTELNHLRKLAKLSKTLPQDIILLLNCIAISHFNKKINHLKKIKTSCDTNETTIKNFLKQKLGHPQ